MIRRQFLRLALVVGLGCVGATKIMAQPTPTSADAPGRPNILWLTSEDNGPELGCYGDDYADTPHLDDLAARGMIYLHAWSNAPVCAPARTTIIAGMYASATGGEHMRSMVSLPGGMRMFPQLLRAAGYYCTNNSKEDYNLSKPGQVWDESSRRAHWKNRKTGQPFFAVFNYTTTHESQIRKRPHDFQHDVAKAPVPAYHPDTPEVRRGWAQYYDKLTEMDGQIGQGLAELKDAGLAEDTIVFYFGDHGTGLPRGKRWLYQTGLRVPMVVYIPDKYRHLMPPDYVAGGHSERLVSFVDLAPTVLNLAGIDSPDYFHGQPFAGADVSPTGPNYLHGYRARMDARVDLSRAVRDKRYLYIRNYMPHKPRGQYLAYMFQTPTTLVWKSLFDSGQLKPAQQRFWQTKSPEELYDLEEDVDQVHNLIDSPRHQDVRDRLREAHRAHVLEVRDLGLLPEAEMHARRGDLPPLELAGNADAYPLKKILQAAELASSLDPQATADLIESLGDDDAAVRYWAATGLMMRGREGVQPNRELLRRALEDSSASVRVAAAEALANHGEAADVEASLELLAQHANPVQHGTYVAIAALNALDLLDEKALPVASLVRELPQIDPSAPNRVQGYPGRIHKSMFADLDRLNQ